LDRCEACEKISSCTVCGHRVTGFDHIGVRASKTRQVEKGTSLGRSRPTTGSGIWHFSRPCGHRISSPAVSPRVKYNGGPLWKDGYTWQSIYWGSYFTTASSSSWVKRIETAIRDIESDNAYSGGLSEYNVGIGKIIPHTIIKTNPPTRLSDSQIKQTLTGWINQGTVSNFGSTGAYNIFLPPGVTVTLSPLEASCKIFCDYHNTVNNAKGPFYTVEPYPCSQGCNHCTNDPFDTLTQGLSEEMVELKTDMDPGTGWVIGNEEICDYCDANFVCNRISTGEYVNAWYDKGKNACWRGISASNSELLSTGFDPSRSRVETGT
jgi:hypothetical protein